MFALPRARPPSHGADGSLRDRTPSYAVAPSVSSEATTVREGAGRTPDGDEEDTAEEPSEYRHTRPKKTMRMNESRQTRGAAAAGASTSSSPRGAPRHDVASSIAEQIAAQQHPATHPAALSINR